MQESFQESECLCSECKSLCKRYPCWPTPDESLKLMKSGYGDKLMLDFFVGGDHDIYIVCPACEGHEAKNAPSWLAEGKKCTFLDSSELCYLHGAGLKPLEGRVVNGCGERSEIHRHVAMVWDSPHGREVVQAWKKYIKHRSSAL